MTRVTATRRGRYGAIETMVQIKSDNENKTSGKCYTIVLRSLRWFLKNNMACWILTISPVVQQGVSSNVGVSTLIQPAGTE
mmetsp:Transcript_19370/g.40859  ORF Transcript_19370/g.40859 Transcript_19370/m.40859 type:complete len:81 (-) Transcript_19370:694-936(-)